MMLDLESTNFAVPSITPADLKDEKALVRKLRAQQELINALVRDVGRLTVIVDSLTS